MAGRGGKGGGDDVSAEIGRAFQSGLPILGKVKAVNKGGVEVEVAGTSAFCPISQLDLQRVEDANVFVGRELDFLVTKFEAGGGRPNIVLSRRAVLETERAQKVVGACSTPAKLEPTTGAAMAAERPFGGACTSVYQGLGGQDHTSCALLNGCAAAIPRFQAHTLPLVSPA